MRNRRLRIFHPRGLHRSPLARARILPAESSHFEWNSQAAPRGPEFHREHSRPRINLAPKRGRHRSMIRRHAPGHGKPVRIRHQGSCASGRIGGSFQFQGAGNWYGNAKRDGHEVSITPINLHLPFARRGRCPLGSQRPILKLLPPGGPIVWIYPFRLQHGTQRVAPLNPARFPPSRRPVRKT